MMTFSITDNRLIAEKLIRQTLNFWGWTRQDDRLHTDHIIIYQALLSLWSKYSFSKKFPIITEDIMLTCGIRVVDDISQFLSELEEFGYILYFPANKIGDVDRISIVRLTKKRSYISIEWKGKVYGALKSLKASIAKRHDFLAGMMGRAPLETMKSSPFAPTISNVKEYFRRYDYPQTEALLFFRYQQFTSWEIEDESWETAAHLWMMGNTNLSVNADGELSMEQDWKRVNDDEDELADEEE